MKKIIALILLAGLLLAFAGCGKIEVRFTFKDEPAPVVQTDPPTEPPTTEAPTTEAPTTEPETTAANVDTGNAD